MGYYMAGGLFDAIGTGLAAHEAWDQYVSGPVVNASKQQPSFSGGGGGGGWMDNLRGGVPQIDVGGPMGLGYYNRGRSYRRMNVLNPRALRRSMRRVQGFAKFARKTISFTSRVKMRKRGRR
jgi:hypothetical protein